MKGVKPNRLSMFGVLIGILILGQAVSAGAQGKNPLILIPGLSGSELRHKDTKERFWFRAWKSKTEDLRLPVTPDIVSAHDNLVVGDVIRSVKLGAIKVSDIYGGFIRAMQVRGGYHEERWDAPSENGFEDSLYVFPYDWRMDNVSNARLLVRKIEALKQKLNKPDLKFDVVGHSMGGIITRYAVMYGDADLPDGDTKPEPTWTGAKLFDKIILLGTPNEGSALTLSNLIEGFNIAGLRIDLPFLLDTSKFTIFTIPSGYQLLPAPGTLRAYDDQLKPISIDIYDPKVWSKYGWNVINDKGFDSVFKPDEKKDAAAFFAAALHRAKKLHEALSAANGQNGGAAFYAIGADCKTAVDAIVVFRDPKTDRWKTYFRPQSFTRADGKRVSKDELKKLMYVRGDGIVSQRSLEAATESGAAGTPSIYGGQPGEYICEDHLTLATNSRIQDRILTILDGKVRTKNQLRSE